MEKIIELKEKIDTLYAAIKRDFTLQVEKSNQLAAIRARKASIELESLLKELRKESIILSKKQTGEGV